MRTRRTILAGALAMAGVLTLGACASDPLADGKLDSDAEFVGVADKAQADDAMVAASVHLAGQLVAAGKGENVVVSPLSLQLALAVLREGASGAVADQIDAAIGVSGDDPSQTVADLRAMLSRYEGDVSTVNRDEPPAQPLVHIGDAVFVQEGFAVEQNFLDRTAGYHKAQVFQTDFQSGTAGPALDAWVEAETGGLLKQSPSDPSSTTRVVLLDAVVFAASWQSQFAPEDTLDRAFTLASGDVVEVPTMEQTFDAIYAEGAGWRAVELPYSDGFAMRIVLPDEGITGDLEWSAVHGALNSASLANVALTMPSWETDALVDLTPMLSDLGLDAMIDPNGDLDGLFRDASVSGVAQAATITVAEKGTVAAAVTQVTVGTTAVEPSQQQVELHLDRPFEYQVIERSTGLVLFAGMVADPS